MSFVLIPPFGVQRGAPRRRSPFFRTKKLAIIGATNSYIYAPWGDPSWTVAAHCCVWKLCPQSPDWWFDLHPPACFKKPKQWHKDYYGWLKNLQTPIFMQEEWPEIPMAVRYPKERILAEYRAYFTNQVAWMIALALAEGMTHIGLFGCEYKVERERGKQRGSCEYWLGVFEGAGGHVILPPNCGLLNDPAQLYGYESHDPQGKLIDAYRMPKAEHAPPPDVDTKTPAETPDRSLMVIHPKSAEGRPPLMNIGESPAWERSGHLVHA